MPQRRINNKNLTKAKIPAPVKENNENNSKEQIDAELKFDQEVLWSISQFEKLIDSGTLPQNKSLLKILHL